MRRTGRVLIPRRRVSPWLWRTTFIDQIFSLSSCSQSGKSCNRSLCTSSLPSFLLLFSVFLGLCIGFPRSSSLVLSTFWYWIFGVSVDVKYRILWWRCWSRCVCCGGTCWLTADYEWHIVWHIAINSLAFFGEMWFLTAGPVVGTPMILAELPESENCRCIFEKHYCHE